MPQLVIVSDQPSPHDHLARSADHPQWAPRHTKPAVIGQRRRVEFELVSVGWHHALEFDRNALARRMQSAPHVHALAVQRDLIRYEPNRRMVGGIEEVRRTQVLVASGVVRVEAVRLDRELDRRLRVEVDRAVIAIEAALDRLQAVQVADLEPDARALGVDPPERVLDIWTVGRVVVSDAHRCLLRDGGWPEAGSWPPRG